MQRRGRCNARHVQSRARYHLLASGETLHVDRYEQQGEQQKLGTRRGARDGNQTFLTRACWQPMLEDDSLSVICSVPGWYGLHLQKYIAGVRGRMKRQKRGNTDYKDRCAADKHLNRIYYSDIWDKPRRIRPSTAGTALDSNVQTDHLRAVSKRSSRG
jgi:hypothetical protein